VGRVGLWGLVGAAGGIWVLGGIGVEAVVVVGCAVVVKGPGIGRGSCFTPIVLSFCTENGMGLLLSEEQSPFISSSYFYGSDSCAMNTSQESRQASSP
jgi:hypothetical protein